jgi:tetrahydromethanopterin S-methyltransferase subunit G
MSNKYLTLDGLKYAIDNYTVSPVTFASSLDTKADINIVTDSFDEIKERIDLLESKIEMLRSEMDARTENPKVKSDLEIFLANGQNSLKSINLWYEWFIQEFEVI